MSNKTINELNLKINVENSDTIPIFDSSETNFNNQTKKIKVEQIKNVAKDPYFINNHQDSFPLIQDSSGILLIGQSNEVTNSLDCTLLGINNNLQTDCKNSLITGNHNSIKTTNRYNVVSGNSNYINSYSHYSNVIGYSNITSTGCSSSIITGNFNYISNNSYSCTITGNNNQIKNYAGYSSVIGNNNFSYSKNAIVVGLNSRIKSTLISANYSIAIGNAVIVNSFINSIAIGKNAEVGFGANTGENAIQLGTGVNNNSNTLQFQNVTIANDQGIEVKTGTVIPSVAARNGTLYIHSTNNDFYFRSSNIWHKISNSSSSNPYVLINSSKGYPSISSLNATDGIAIGPLASIGNRSQGNISIGLDADIADDSSNNICIGNNPGISQDSLYNLCIGYFAKINTGNDSSISIGKNATVGINCDSSIALGSSANVTAFNAIQLGAGTNSLANTLQYLTKTIATTDGLFLTPTTGVPTAIAKSGTLRWDKDTNTLYISNGTSWKSIVLN